MYYYVKYSHIILKSTDLYYWGIMSKSALKILDTAEKLFNEQSFTGVGVDLIRDVSGCSKTTLYTYFKNKNELIKQVLSVRDERYRRSLMTYVDSHTNEEKINCILKWHMEWFQSKTFKGCMFVRAVGESVKTQGEIIEYARQHKVWLRSYIYQACESFENHRIIADLIYHILEGLISRFLVEDYDADVAEQAYINMNTMISALESLKARV